MNSDFTHFISEKIDSDTNIIWFKKSNKYIVLNDIINILLLNKLKPSLYPINNDFIREHQINSSKLKDINKDLENLVLECNSKKQEEENKKIDINNNFLKCQSSFKFNNRVIKILYENENLRNLIDPKFIHLKTQEKENLTFKVFEKNKKIYLFKEDLFLGGWGLSKMHEFQGKISMEITSFFHNMNDKDWSAVFHGSTLSYDNNSVMLTGGSGNGKSSLSTILMANNYSLVADDFSPMNNKGVHYHFPSAISIKEGFYPTAQTLFKSFSKLKEYYINEIKGNVKYLPNNDQNSLRLFVKCNKVINVKFGKNFKNEIKLINKGIALQRILPDAWISKDRNHSIAFINWVKKSLFYDLTYSDNEEAVKLINNIF